MLSSLFLSAVAATEVCDSSMQEMGIAKQDCEAIHTEFVNMVDSGKSIEELETDLNQCGASADFAPMDNDMACQQACKMGNESCGSCMKIRQMESNCRLDTPGCARQVAYGGYVKSHVLIQCYGIIQEGCQRLPTKVMPAVVDKQNCANGGDGCWPLCKQLCAEGCKGDSCGNCSCGNLRGNEWLDGCSVGNPGCGKHSCMKANFSRYLHCVGRRVSKCYRQKWTTTRECENAAPTEWGGCKQEWDQKYNCCSSHVNHGSLDGVAYQNHGSLDGVAHSSYGSLDGVAHSSYGSLDGVAHSNYGSLDGVAGCDSSC